MMPRHRKGRRERAARKRHRRGGIGIIEPGSEPQTLKLGRKKMHRYYNWRLQHRRALAQTLAHQAVAETESSDASVP